MTNDKFNNEIMFLIIHVTNNVQNDLSLQQMTIWVLFNVCMHNRESVNVYVKNSIFFVHRIQSFQPNLTLLSENLKTNSKNNMLQLKPKYMKYVMRYGYSYEIIFICACVKDLKIYIS